MMVKSSPATSLIMIETQLVLELLEITLDTPSEFRQPDQILEGHLLRQSGKPVARGLFFAGGPLYEKPLGLSATMKVSMSCTNPHPSESRAHQSLRPLPPSHRLPGFTRQPLGQIAREHRRFLRDTQSRRCSSTPHPRQRRRRLFSKSPEARIGQDPHCVGKTSLGQCIPKLRRCTIARICNDGRQGNLLRDQFVDLCEGEGSLGPKLHLPRNSGGLATLRPGLN